MNFGGPTAGFIACREKFMRQMPGRLAGRTVDKDGKQAFCLTIQTREQHIKREKRQATSVQIKLLLDFVRLYIYQ